VTQPGTPVLHLELPAEPGMARTVRRAVADSTLRLRTLDRSDLVMLVNELITAMVAGESRLLVFELWRSERGFRVEVRCDGSHGELDPLAEALLDQLTSHWYIRPGVGGFEFDVRGLFDDSEPDAELFRRCAQGDLHARDILVARYESYAHGLSHRFIRKGVEREDLEQVAALGLVKALERFDPERGVRFATFATRTIEGELKRHLRDSGWSLRVPRGLQELGLEATRAAADLAQDSGREPTLDEVSEALGDDSAQVGEALLAWRSFSAASLDSPIGPELELRLMDTIPSHDERLRIAPEWADLSRVIDQLPERDRHILYLRFFEDLRQSEIATRVGISQMHVSRLLAKSIAALRSLLAPNVAGF